LYVEIVFAASAANQQRDFADWLQYLFSSSQPRLSIMQRDYGDLVSPAPISSDCLTQSCTALYSTQMLRKGAEEARNQLPQLIDAAEQGRSTIITRHGRPVAALVPIEAHSAAIRQQPLTPVEGSGRGFWGRNSSRTVRKLRDEWNR
jgi:prevent-host-death family protein